MRSKGTAISKPECGFQNETKRAWVKLAAPAASRSKFGVRMRVLPFAPRASQRCWSVMMKRLFGRGAGAEATDALGTSAVAAIARQPRQGRNLLLIARKAS